MINILLEEYKALKSEQLSRIKLRDTLIYISLGIFGAIFSYAMFSEGNDKSIVLLMLPTVSLILAWTYVVNDEKISHIGKYVRHELAPKLRELVGKDDPIIFGWELYHRSDYKRLTRKTMQVAIDIIVFVLAPVASMYAYYTKNPDSGGLVQTLTYWNIAVIGLICILLLAYDHSERKKDKS